MWTVLLGEVAVSAHGYFPGEVTAQGDQPEAFSAAETISLSGESCFAPDSPVHYPL